MSGQLHAVQHTTSAGTVAVVAAPGAGYRITVVGFHVSEGSAGVVTLGFSAGNQKVWNMAANQNIDVGLTRWEGDANTALSLTSPATGPTDVEVDYVLELAP